MLGGVGPDVARDADVRVLTGILEGAAGRLAAGEVGDELVAAELHVVVGRVYGDLYQFAEAEHHLSTARVLLARAVGEDHPDAVEAILKLARVYGNQRRILDAEPLFAHLTEVRRRHLGADHPDTLVAMSRLLRCHAFLERYDDVEELRGELVTGWRRVLGRSTPRRSPRRSSSGPRSHGGTGCPRPESGSSMPTGRARGRWASTTRSRCSAGRTRSSCMRGSGSSSSCSAPCSRGSSSWTGSTARATRALRSEALETLARAQHACGEEERAIATAEEALLHVPERADDSVRARIRGWIRAWRDG